MIIQVSTKAHIEIVESLAKEIWNEHYTPIIGKKQVDYMLERFQSGEAIAEQISKGCLYFLIQENNQSVGYVCVQPKEDELFLSKIYVHASKRGKGYGRKALQFIEKIAEEEGLKRIVLTVNKNNISSIRAYEKMGFKNCGSLIQDIGGGFIMDDFKMEKEL